MIIVVNFTRRLQKNIKKFAGAVFVLLSVAANATLKVYPVLAGMQGCQFNYTMQVKEPGDLIWKTVPLYNALVTTSTDQGEYNTTVANFDCDGPVDIKIIFSKPVSSAAVYPASLNVTPSFGGDSITFSISGPKKFYVDINGDHYNNCMNIIADPLEINPPQQGDPNVIFVPTGTYVDSIVSLQSGQTLYVQGGAAVRGVYADEASNIKVLGRGYVYHSIYDALNITHCNNVTIDGLIDLNHGWNNGGGCGFRCGNDSNTVISNTVSFSALKWGDGYDIFSSDNVTVDNVYIRTNDDAICFYGGGASGFTGDCKNITVKNSTLLPDLAHSFNVGVYGDTTGVGREIRDIYVSNVDICNASRTPSQGCINFMVSDKVRAANFHFDDVRVQNFVDARLITMNIIKYSWYYGRGIDSIFYNNIKFTGSTVPSSVIEGNNASEQITNVKFTDLMINGSKITNAANGNVTIGNYTQNISFGTTGTVPAITSTTTADGKIDSAFNYTISATNSPTNYNATNLPSGLSIDTVTGVISGTPTAAGTFNVNLKASNDSGAGILPLTLTIAPVGNPIARYTFDNTVADSSGNNFVAILNGGTTFTNGAIKNALKLNGTDGYASLRQGILNSVSDMTIAAWVKLDTVAASSRIFDLGQDSTANMYLTSRSSTGKIRFTISNGGTEQDIDGNTPLPAGKWVHLAVTLSGNTGILYVNGDSVGSNFALTLNPSDLGVTARNFIGRSQFVNDPYLKGIIDEFQIYNRALRSYEIDSLIGKGVAIVTSSDSAAGFREHSFTYNVSAVNNPISYNATGLPQGISINTNTGLISGTPTVSGIFPVNIIVANPNGIDTALLTLTILSDTVSNLFVAAGDAKDTLLWDPMTIAQSYNVKRSETTGGPYTIISNTKSNGFMDTTVVNGHVYYYTVAMVDSIGEHAGSVEVSAAPNDGQVDYYNFDETSGSKVNDYWGAQSGTLVSNAVTRVPGIINSAVHFNGTANSYITLPAGLISKLTNFTISAWVKTDVNATWERVFDFGTGTTNYMFLTTNNGSNSVRYAITTGNGEQGINSSVTFSNGVWHHIAVTLSGNTGTLYIDGVASGSNTSMTLNPASLGITNLDYIGKSQWNDPLMNGAIDDFKIYGRALSAAEIDSMVVGHTPPMVPTNFAVFTGNNQATLKWNSSKSAKSYELLRSVGNDSSYTAFADNISDTSITDTTAYNCGSYYYKIIAKNDVGVSDTSQSVSTFAGNKLTGTLIGTDSSWNNNPATRKTAAVDGDLNTYFDAPNVNGGWVGYDFGAGSNSIIREIRYAPRNELGARMSNGLFQGANNEDFSDAVVLFTVPDVPPSGVMTSKYINNNQSFRYIRYLSPNNGSCNIAELEFWGVPAKLPAITHTDALNAAIDSAFSYSIVASNAPSAYTATGLPNGLQINNCSGIISGTPSTEGTFTAPITVTNYYGTVKDTLIIIVKSNKELPINLLPLTGKLNGENVLLNWQTVSENNSDYFEVERSANGLSFKAIGKVSAAGNSTQLKNYTYTDNVSGIESTEFYYRLKETDKDGHTQNSNTIIIKKDNSTNDIFVYPNPATTATKVWLQYVSTSNNSITIMISNIAGNAIRQFKKDVVSGVNKIDLNTDNLASGVYFISVENKEGSRYQVKLIKR